ncbi:MAG: type II toxin-antitoxin system RelE/ParE family toxin [bacterium]|nr:type II toxin-antitoxin system RelE/ParE family toxin [bacterium]
MKYSFHPQAKKELKDAVKYYNVCGAGLGFVFFQEVQATIQRILQYPKSWTKLSKKTRQCLTRRYPYAVIFQEVDAGIIIIAVMHLKRKPGYWLKRLD